MSEKDETVVEWEKDVQQNQTVTKKGKKIDVKVEIDNKAFTDLANENAELKRKLEELENSEPEKNHKPDVVGHGGSGSVPLSHNTEPKEQESYESHEALVFDIMDRASNGDKEAQAVKAELQKKFFRAIKSGDIPTVLYDENQLPEDKLKTEKSILFKILERENNRIRRKALERRGETVID